jgi:hypothetical protein
MLPPITYQQHAVIRMKTIHKLVHLFGGRKRGFIEHIQAALSGVRLCPKRKMFLQRGCFHACIGHLASQTINALGQVIRNFSVNLKGPVKIQVLNATFLLSLRSLARVMQIFETFIKNPGLTASMTNDSRSRVVLKTLLDQSLIALAQIYAFAMFETVSQNIGVLNMEKAYTTAMAELETTVAMRLMAVSVQLHHFNAFPEQEIKQLHKDLHDNKFARSILQWMVGYYLSTHRVAKATRKIMVNLFSLNQDLLEDTVD